MNKPLSLSCGDWLLEVYPNFGMNATRLSYRGEEILRTPEGLAELQEKPYVFGTPLLFPANRTKGARFSFEGEEYTLPLNEPQRGNHLHGLMFDAPFEILEHTENRLVGEYVNLAERYPFPFKITITDSLNDSGYCRELTVENVGKKTMPYTLAYHTTFLERDFSAPVRERYEVDENYIPTGKMLPLNFQETEYVKGTSPTDKIISGFYTIAGHTARIGKYLYQFSQNFDNLVLYNAQGKEGILCIEPQAGAVNGLNSHNYQVLKKGESKTYTHKIELKTVKD